MKTLFRRLAVASMFLTSAAAWTAQAANIISVSYTPVANEMLPDDLAGAPGVRTGNWNSAFTAGSNTTLDLLDGTIISNTGDIVKGLSMTLSTGNGGSTALRGNPPGGVAPALMNDGRMLRTVTDKFEGAEGSIAITGIPYARYSLYFYAYPDAGGGGERGGYFTVTNRAGQVQTRWLKGGTGANLTIPLPDSATGDGYLQSTTATQPANFAAIQAGHFVVMTGLTDPNIEVRYSAVGASAGGVAGGDGTRRLKFSGFQIVEALTGTITSLSLGSPITPLYTGNPQGFGVQVLGLFPSGSSVPLSTLPGATYSSADTNIFTVNSDGLVQPGNPGVAKLVVAYQSLSLTQDVSVLRPVAVRPVLTNNTLLVGATGVPATLLADFSDGKTDVDVTKFKGVAFGVGTPGVANVSTNGLIAAIGVGTFNLTAAFAGVTGRTDNAGSVLAYNPPLPDNGKVAVSVNIQSGRGMTFTDLAGAPGVRVGYWNNVTGLTGGGNTVVLATNSMVEASGKVVSGLSVSVTGGTSTAAGISTRGTQSTNESVMFYGVYDQFNGTSGTIRVSGIPFSVYDAYFYAVSGDADNRPGHFTIGGETRWILDSTAIAIPDNEGNGYVEAITTNAPSSVADVQPGNYVKFSNLKGSTLDVQFVADGPATVGGADSGAPRLKFSGFQLVGTPLAGTPAPALKAALADSTHLRLSWPASAVGYVLKSSTALSGVWNLVNVTPTTDGVNFVVTVTIGTGSGFYILQKP
jgi:hypothetical protein